MIQKNIEDELVDLVNENDQVIGTKLRSQLTKDERNFRVVAALVKNEQGQLFIPRRSLNKGGYRGALGTIGGCVKSGESYEQALIREVAEEANLQLLPGQYKFLGQLNPFVEKVHGLPFIGAYELHGCSQIDYNKEDFAEAFWMHPTEVKSLIDNGEFHTPSLSILINRYYINI